MSAIILIVHLFSSQQVLREVKVLAHLSHNNVVGYHAAWLEYVTTDNVGCALPSEFLLSVILFCAPAHLVRTVPTAPVQSAV